MPSPATPMPPSELGAHHASAWHAIWQGFDAAQPDASLMPALLARYAEPHRKYHTQQHLDACLRQFEAVRHLARHPHEVALALWFHDAIYDIGATDNELRSADWARVALRAAGVDAQATARVHALVMTTRHNVAPNTTDEEILLDADLSILGARPQVFDAYELQIRDENRAIAEDFFRTRRKAILQQFLDRTRIYHTPHFHGLLEAQARANLQRSILQLGG